MIEVTKATVDIGNSEILIDFAIRPDVDVQEDIFQNLINGLGTAELLDLDPSYNEGIKGHAKLRIKIASKSIDPPEKSTDVKDKEEAEKALPEKDRPAKLKVWQARPESLKEQQEILDEKKKAKEEAEKEKKASKSTEAVPVGKK